jgi:hypothetical protein
LTSSRTRGSAPLSDGRGLVGGISDGAAETGGGTLPELRDAYDAWGKRRFANGADEPIPTARITSDAPLSMAIAREAR